MKAISEIRPSPIAGQWYPADPRRLAAQVQQYIEAAHLPELDGEVIAVIAPHAGHIYSGPVAGFAFAACRGLMPEIVVIASPMHYPYSEPLLTTSHAAYATPLGEIEVDRDALDSLDSYLLQQLGYKLSRVARDPEHSLEIELPFLQQVLPKPFRILPIMVREQNERVAYALGKSLGKLFSTSGALEGKTYLLVASTDLSHFYPQSIAELLDAEVLRRIEALDPSGVIEVEDEGTGFACGRGAVAAVLVAAKELGADHARILKYATSGDATGDYDRVVGYGAAVITRKVA